MGRTGCFKKPSVGPVGYPQVTFYRNGKGTTFYVHRLVMLTFVGPCPPGMEVRHLDGIKTHCWLGNLAYGTPSENQRDKVRHGGHHNANKTHCPQGHKYTPENIRTMPSRPGWRYCRTCH